MSTKKIEFKLSFPIFKRVKEIKKLVENAYAVDILNAIISEFAKKYANGDTSFDSLINSDVFDVKVFTPSVFLNVVSDKFGIHFDLYLSISDNASVMDDDVNRAISMYFGSTENIKTAWGKIYIRENSIKDIRIDYFDERVIFIILLSRLGVFIDKDNELFIFEPRNLNFNERTTYVPFANLTSIHVFSYRVKHRKHNEIVFMTDDGSAITILGERFYLNKTILSSIAKFIMIQLRRKMDKTI